MKILMVASLLCSLLLAPSIADARTWLVKQDGSGDCTTVQACVDSAGTGDTVLVYPGTYEEHITISSAMSLIGESGSSVTVIDGTNTGRCILLDNVSSPGVLIEGLTIRNGELPDYPGSYETAYGAGIFSRGSMGLVTDCVLEYIAGMSIACDETSNMTIENNLMQENYTTYVEPPYPVAGGGVITRSSNTLIQENTFMNNMESDVVVQASSPQVIRNRCLGTPYAGGIIGAGTAYIAENLVTNCHHPVRLWGSCEFTQNTVANNGGTGIFVGVGHAPVISKNIVVGNNIGIDCSNGSASLYCNDVWDNTDNYWGPSQCFGMTTDFHLDPQFCAPAVDNYYLNQTSPCLDHPDCGQVGAYGMGCVGLGVPDPQLTTWGKIKALYR